MIQIEREDSSENLLNMPQPQ